MIEKLKQFTQIDVDGIPHVIVSVLLILWFVYAMMHNFTCKYNRTMQEKMCLLIMSLPANQLSIQPVMAAIEVNLLVQNFIGNPWGWVFNLGCLYSIVCLRAHIETVTQVAESAKEFEAASFHDN